MLHLFGEEDNLTTITSLAYPFLDRSVPLTARSVKDAYREFLRTVQPKVPVETGGIHYIRDRERAADYLAAFRTDSMLTDTRYQFETADSASRAAVEEARQAVGRIEAGACSLAARDTSFGNVYPLAMNAVFHAPSKVATGGTTSGALGVLWVDPRETWQERDIQEFLYHELGHTLLFLDERRFGLFTSYPQMVDRKNWVTSAIRGTVRPLDKAFHSAVVATEVLLAREETLGHPMSAVLHPLSPQLASGALTSARDIERSPARQLLTKHAAGILRRSRDQVERLAARHGWSLDSRDLA
ncbi:HEXXH motif-containing putative peptide modification protein [Streptomyces sp. SL13]|uniref:HEXXH motif-containing putative peptide modification protein n=1 Tax=Streptantibioticus silvisoli TaxID=2705255 RepID=A0AA90HFG4_9ACTN|nr:HEXXH motif-containing putative peptide modification protein [Streptantibioticus silvisoli]MDI5973972.1 HEXXH motif-containing putative peptide modification protein [Streptantibioticus silvisoli]